MGPNLPRKQYLLLLVMYEGTRSFRHAIVSSSLEGTHPKTTTDKDKFIEVEWLEK